MKNFAKLIIAAVAVVMVASLFALTLSAASGNQLVDPNTLKPGSNKVIFIKDGERDETGKPTGVIEGDGTGSDANNPLKTYDHEDFDPTATAPKWHLQTAFYQATDLLKNTGGTIVICGPVYFGQYESYGNGASTRDVFTAKFGENTIKITSVYDGVDYRETAGAKITVDSPAEIGVYGQSIWENIDIETAGKRRSISFSNYATLVGEGVKCYPADPSFEGVATNYISLSAGHRYSGGVDITTNLVVKSGSYNFIAAGQWGVNTTRKYAEDGVTIKTSNNLDGNTRANLVLEGTTTVYGQVIGTNVENSEFSGNVNITINGGKYECDINMGGTTGFINKDAVVTLKINGGDFSSCWSVNDAVPGYKNNAPAISKLDLSGWTGDKLGLANLCNVVTYFTDVVFPDGVTVDELAALLSEQTEPAATTSQPENETKSPENETEKPADSETEAPSEETDAVSPVEPENDDGMMAVLIAGIGIGLAIAVVAVIVVLVIVKKKK